MRTKNAVDLQSHQYKIIEENHTALALCSLPPILLAHYYIDTFNRKHPKSHSLTYNNKFSQGYTTIREKLIDKWLHVDSNRKEKLLDIFDENRKAVLRSNVEKLKILEWNKEVVIEKLQEKPRPDVKLQNETICLLVPDSRRNDFVNHIIDVDVGFRQWPIPCSGPKKWDTITSHVEQLFEHQIMEEIVYEIQEADRKEKTEENKKLKAAKKKEAETEKKNEEIKKPIAAQNPDEETVKKNEENKKQKATKSPDLERVKINEKLLKQQLEVRNAMIEEQVRRRMQDTELYFEFVLSHQHFLTFVDKTFFTSLNTATAANLASGHLNDLNIFKEETRILYLSGKISHIKKVCY